MRHKRQFLILFLAGLLLANFTSAKNRLPVNNEGEGGNKSTKGINAGCVPATASTELDLNNVRALIHTGGDMWWDLQGQPRYEVPKESGKHSMFAGTIWIGGTDVNGQLRLAGLQHRTYGVDYWPGPLVKTGSERSNVTSDVCIEYDKHFVIDRDEVSKFRAWYASDDETRLQEYEGYSIPDIILDWPAHGDATNGYDYYLAPFYDADGNASYDPNEGDYPFYDLDGAVDCGTTKELRTVRLYGDKTLWWVYNDKGNIHGETGGAAIGMELRAQAFAFSTNDELNNMTFGNYEIINRSTYTLENCYFGVWTDADLGDPDDDYVGCDVAKGLGYLYNGDEIDGDGNGKSYGAQPPAIGIDFFEGPYQDNDLQDNLSSWDAERQLDCDFGYAYRNDAGEPDPSYGTYRLVGPCDLKEGNINGLNFGDGRVDNERWGMRRFIYFNRNTTPTGDPTTAVQYYYYLRGYWKDGSRMQYGGTGHQSGGADADFMFPGSPTTDPCGWGTDNTPQDPWSEETEGNTPFDRRFVQSAGPFTLEPGMVNDITVGVVWARASNGGAWQSVEEVRRADDKAQRLFENCFKVVDGPDAPELSFVELDKEIIFHIWNKPSPTSNNYMESYLERDPFIVCPLDEPACDQYYTFQGYQVFQLKNGSTSIDEIDDPDAARQVFQCDIKDNVTQLVNYTYSEELSANIPAEMVNGSNDGIQHTFRITADMFASGDQRLVNNKDYYFIAIAYGYNEFKAYNQHEVTAIDGQKQPYKAGRKGAEGSISSVRVTPHLIDPLSSGTVLNSSYGDGVEVSRIEGSGNGNNFLMLNEATEAEIMSGEPWKASKTTYLEGAGPINVTVIDPLNVVSNDYVLRFNRDSSNIFVNGFIKESKWFVYPASEENQYEYDHDNGSVISYPPSTIFAANTTLFNGSQLLLDLGISIEVVQVEIPIQGFYLQTIETTDIVNYYLDDNGYIGEYVLYEDQTKAWLWGVFDEEDCGPMDWVSSGTADDEDNPQCADYTTNGKWSDENEVYESVQGGSWAPYVLCAEDDYGDDSRRYGVAFNEGRANIDYKKFRFSSVDLIITKDRSKWTRCPVFETCENDTTPEGLLVPGPSEGNTMKFDLRASPSIDKDGNFSTDSTSSENEDDANYISETGMGWFPGYAIDVESGERLNLAYGEDSWLGNDNGRDMMWNPSANYYSDLGEVLLGGKHFLFVMGHNMDCQESEYMPAYDAGRYMTDMLKTTTSLDCGASTYTKKLRKNYVYRNVMWVYYPTAINPDLDLTTYDNIPTDVRMGVRIASPYWRAKYSSRFLHDTSYTVVEEPDDELIYVVNGSAISTGEPLFLYNYDSTNALYNVTGSYEEKYSRNYNLPMYTFSTQGLEASRDVATVAKNALDLIRVVPNPYNAHNAYEQNQLDYMIKITNLPQSCTISIFTPNGKLIRRMVKDSDETSMQWNLKNEYGILIASGMYIIHIDAPGIGQTVVKWFGSLRPMDMNNF